MAIFSTSITKGINLSELLNSLKNASVEIHKFCGKKAIHIKNYIKSHLAVEVPDSVVIHMGSNDLSRGQTLHWALTHDIVQFITSLLQSRSCSDTSNVNVFHPISFTYVSCFNDVFREICGGGEGVVG